MTETTKAHTTQVECEQQATARLLEIQAMRAQFRLEHRSREMPDHDGLRPYTYPDRFSSPQPRDRHRYAEGEEVQTKDGRVWTVREQVWRVFRWFPLDAAYVLEEVGVQSRYGAEVRDDGQLW